jgi:hypothetical protein
MNAIKLTLLTPLLLVSLAALLPHAGTSFSQAYPFEVRTTDIVTTFP